MLDKAEFQAIRDRLSGKDAAREDVIKRSRDIGKASKAAIYCLQRKDLPGAKARIAEAEEAIAALAPKIKEPDLRTGGYSAGMEEYAEARLLLRFLEKGDVLPLRELNGVDDEEYLGALSDLTGELGRMAVLAATEGDRARVGSIRECMDAIFGELVLMDFRNSDLRRKYDAVKYNLQKVENLLADMAIRAQTF